MKYLDIEELSFFQIDHTSRCNLQCPQCARTHSDQLNSELPLGELSFEDYKKIFNPRFLNQAKKLKKFLFNGNYGDAAISETLKPSLQFLKENGIQAITLMTNGSLRTASWWSDLAKIMNRTLDKVVFSIDGLEDTNSIYRINSKWEKIIENANAFISAGGRARWDFIVFDHNAHQLEAAQVLAKKLGFHEFSIKKTNRFLSNNNYNSGKKSVTQEVKLKNNEKVEISIPVSNEKYISNSTKNFDQLIQKHHTWSDYIDQSKITCKYKKWGNGLFIDFEARLWPCTWLASPLHHFGDTNSQKNQILKLLDRYGNDFNSLRKYSFEEVFEHRWFQSELVESWSKTQNDSNPKLMTCGRTCGDEYDFSSASEENRTFVKL
jgi:MoaA/NifB/PqqE/SkfB family radical SAM enzyme